MLNDLDSLNEKVQRLIALYRDNCQALSELAERLAHVSAERDDALTQLDILRAECDASREECSALSEKIATATVRMKEILDLLPPTDVQDGDRVRSDAIETSEQPLAEPAASTQTFAREDPHDE